MTTNFATEAQASCFTVHDTEGLEALPSGTNLTDRYGDEWLKDDEGGFRCVYDGEPSEYADPSSYFDIEFPFVVENAAILGREIEEEPLTEWERELLADATDPEPETLAGFKVGDRVLIDIDEASALSVYNGEGVVVEFFGDYLKVELANDWAFLLPSEVEYIGSSDEQEPTELAPYELVVAAGTRGVVLPREEWSEGMRMADGLIALSHLLLADVQIEPLVGIQPVEDRPAGLERTPFVAQRWEVERAA